MSVYDILNLDEITEYVSAYYQGLLPDHDVSRTSDNFKRIRTLCLAIADAHAHGLAVWRKIMAQTSDGSELVDLAAAWGIEKKGATVSSGTLAGRVRGTVGSPYADTDQLTHANGLTYRLGATGTIPGVGFVDVDIISVSTGSQTKLDAGQVLRFASTPSGLEDTVELQLPIDQGGDDAELDGELRNRLLERMAQPGQGGSKSDWAKWILAVVNIAEAYVYPHRDGFGTVDVAAFKRGQSTARALSAGERASLLTVLQLARPVTQTVRVLETEADSVAIKLRITPEDGDDNQRDWDDATPLVVSSYTPATRVLVFTANRPADMRAGDRVCWDNAGGELATIQALSSTNAVILSADPSVAPSGNVYSGGPLTAAVQKAVKRLIDGYLDDGGEYHDSIGPTPGDFGEGWDGTVRVTSIKVASSTVTGVLDTEVDAPVANYTPVDYAYPVDTKTKFATYSYVFVRYA